MSKERERDRSLQKVSFLNSLDALRMPKAI